MIFFVRYTLIITVRAKRVGGSTVLLTYYLDTMSISLAYYLDTEFHYNVTDNGTVNRIANAKIPAWRYGPANCCFFESE